MDFKFKPIQCISKICSTFFEISLSWVAIMIWALRSLRKRKQWYYNESFFPSLFLCQWRGKNQTILQKLGWSHWSLLPQYLLPLNHLQVVSYSSSSFFSVPLSQQWILEASVYVLRWNRQDTVAKLANSDMGCWLDQRSLNWTRNFPVPPVGNLASGLQMHWQPAQVKDGMVGSYWEEGISLSPPLA